MAFEVEFSKRLDLFGAEIFAALNDKKVALEAQGKKLYNLSVGTPDFEPMPHIKQALCDAAMVSENWKYSLRDLPELLDTVCAYYKRRFDVDGMVTDQPDLTDDLYENAALHSETGAWQMIFGVVTRPEYRKHGLAAQLLNRAIADARQQGRKGLVLTCKDKLVHYYAKFGFVTKRL